MKTFRFVFVNYWRFALLAAVVCLWIGSTMTPGNVSQMTCYSLAGVWAFSGFTSWINRRNLPNLRKMGADLSRYKSLWADVAELAEQQGALTEEDKARIWQRANRHAEVFNREFNHLHSCK